MCLTGKCKYECSKGLCMAGYRKPDDAYCMMEGEEEPEATKKTAKKRTRKKAA